MFWQSTIAASLLALPAHAGILAMTADGDLAGRASAELERRINLASGVGALAEEYHEVSKRQSVSSQGVLLNPDGTINMTAWEETVNTACNVALTRLPESSNPSGTCICYNLPALDNSTGAFEADLRLYSLSTPTGEFDGIPPEKIQVGLSYRGASVTPVSAQTAQKLVATKRQSLNIGTNGNPAVNTGLKLLQTYLFVGQIDKDKLTAIANSPTFDAQLEALVMPTLTLTATNPQGKNIATNVSSNEAAFVAGVFSKDVIMSDFAIAQAAVDDIVNRLHNFDVNNPTNPLNVAFVLPGVQIMIFPIGLVITGIWLAVAISLFTYGTFMRMTYRDQFRRQTARAGDKGTI